MKQVIQNYRTGILEVAEVPAPRVRPGTLLVRNLYSVVSSGTERMVVDMARRSLIGKALARPDLVRRVIEKARVDGVAEAFEQVRHRLDAPVPLGYSSCGEVIAVGDGVVDFRVGERVACGGQGVATHSEVVCAPRTLAARVPPELVPEEAAFAMVGAIALHAVRLAGGAAGESVAVVGLGLLGLLAAQILKASGCRVIGIDISPAKTELARTLGLELVVVQGQGDAVSVAQAATEGRGVDAVLVMAATRSHEPIELAARLSRERGRIVSTGLVGLNIPRQLFYEKELEFRVSRSSGPGLYDPDYEQRGNDYPFAYVRWTHARNMAHFLGMLSAGQVRVKPLISHRFRIERATEAYRALTDGGASGAVGVVLEYPRLSEAGPSRVRLRPEAPRPARNVVRVGVIGAGLFARTTLLPELSRLENVELRQVAAASGASAHHVARKFGFACATTDAQEIIADPEVDCVFILTRHKLHASLVVDALAAGKDVFVEKPLALKLTELDEVIQAWRESAGRLMVGFNRRHSPHSLAARQFLESRGAPALIACRVNAGEVPRASWVNDPGEGGGRILGEVCHFVDLVEYLAGATIVRVQAAVPGARPPGAGPEDLAATLELADGSLASLVYTVQGHRALPREWVEVFSQGAVGVIENFRRTHFLGRGCPRGVRTWRQDRGHRNELAAWIRALGQGEPAPVAFREYVAATLATLALSEAIRTSGAAKVDLRLVERCQKEGTP